ncbi:MAG: PaaI family thioesterase [Candidatus Dormibacteria bacterium]
MTERITPGERFADRNSWEAAGADGPHIWRTLGYRRTDWQPGSSTVEWTASPEYCFPTADGAVVQGGLVTALLDTAMGGACWTVLNLDQVFLTADLRVEFLRVSRPGPLSATGTVVRRTRRVVFCAAEVRDPDGAVLAMSRCTQIILPNAGPFGRHGAADGSGAPPQDARG